MLTKEGKKTVTIIELGVLCIVLSVLLISVIISPKIKAIDKSEVTITIDEDDEFTGKVNSVKKTYARDDLQTIEINDNNNGITYYFDLSSRTYEIRNES